MIVVYYGVNLYLVPCRLSISLHAFLFVSLPLFILPSRFPLLPASLSLTLAAPHLLLPTLPLLFPSSPFGQSRLSFSSGLYFSAPDVPPVANIVFLPPPLDMAKEAICALLAILEHFFEAFSPLDLFFALAPFRPVPRPFPASLHPVPSSIPTYSISRPSAQVNIIPAWFPSLSETSARAVFIFRASVA